MLKRRRIINWSYLFAFLACVALITISTLWLDKTRRWILTDLFQSYPDNHKLTIAPVLPKVLPYPALGSTTLTDASWLNSSEVSGLYQPVSSTEVIQIIDYARKLGKKVSFSGVRHSMGGQILLRDSLHISTLKMDAVEYNDSDSSVTVQPGATWKQVQTVLNKHNRAVAVMQDSNIFTVGGSVSVNAHGKDPHFGPLVETINYLKIITATGEEVQLSRTQKSDLFNAVVGGYGVFGYISEINLITVPNSTYSFKLQEYPTLELLNELEKRSNDPAIGMYEAHLNIDSEMMFEKSLVYEYRERSMSPIVSDPDLSGNSSKWVRKSVIEFSKLHDFGKKFRWMMESEITPLIEKKQIQRNEAMAASVSFLEHSDPQHTDVLQEYFVPPDKFYAFLDAYKSLVKNYKLNLINVTVRKVPAETLSTLSYVPVDRYGIVAYYSLSTADESQHNLASFTKELGKTLLQLDSSYYLCYGSYLDHEVVRNMYPGWDDFIKLKKEQDPEMLFSNIWLEQILSN